MNDDPSLDRLRELEVESSNLRAQLEAVRAAPLSHGLSKREALLVEAERVAHLGSWAWDLAKGEIEWSDELYRILGYEAAQVRPSSEAFFAAIHADDRARVQAHASQNLAEDLASPVEFRVLRANGELRSVRMEAAILHDEHGKQTHIVGTVLDLTESLTAAALLSRTIEELRNAQRVARLGSYTWDLPSGRLGWSTGMFDLFGLDGSEIPTEALFAAHVHPDDVDFINSERDAAVATGSPRSSEYRIVQRDSTVLNVVMDSQPQLDSEGKLVGFRGVIQDITRRKQLEEQLRQSQKMEAVGTLAGGVAHDFNNYLMVLSGQSDFLRQRLGPNHPGLTAIDAIQAACTRCAALTSQLLTLSRKRIADPQHIELGALLTHIAPMLRSVLGEASELVINCEEPNAFVLADPAQLEQAIMNLTINARDAMPNGGRLTLSVDRVVVEQAGAGASESSIRLSVSDTGTGIAPEHCARVFEPFFTTKEVGRGTGLGLTTTYGIVKQAGGRIDVESDHDRGTTFRIFLPPSSEGPVTPTLPPQERIEHSGGHCVLVVEDVAEVRVVLREQLERGGYRVMTAAHGQAALELLASAREPIDIVLSDVVMPVMGGLELERRLAARFPGVPCILMTGYSASTLGHPSASRVVLRKPFSSKDLLATVREQARQLHTNP